MTPRAMDARARMAAWAGVSTRGRNAAFWGIAALAVLVFPFAAPGMYWISVVQLIAIYGIVALGLNLVMGYAGQAWIAHAPLYAAGAYTSAILASRLGWPFWASLAAAPLVAAVLGISTVPALRVRGPHLIMLTLAFAVVVQAVILHWTDLTGGPSGIRQIPAASLLGLNLRGIPYYYVTMAFLAAIVWVTANLVRARVGRCYVALRASEVAAGCMGVDVLRSKIQAIVLASLFSGMAGGLYTFYQSYVSADTTSMSFTILIAIGAILGGLSSIAGPLLGVGVLVFVPTLMYGLGQYHLIAYGVILVATVIFVPSGIVGSVQSLLKRSRPTPAEGSAIPSQLSELNMVASFLKVPAGRQESSVLRFDRVSISFGGIRAVNDLSFQVQAGTVHGLIGPNGSGKSTVVNLISSVYTPTSGHIYFSGVDITGMPLHKVATLGVARTFQNLQIFNGLTVLENIMVGLHHAHSVSFLETALALPRCIRQEAEMREKARALASLVGLEAKIGEPADGLPHYDKRMLEIARALALQPKLLLLDEPAAGLSKNEVATLRQVLARLKPLGLTIIFIEHHLDLVMDYSERVTVLDYGSKVAEGSPFEIQADERVATIYLGG